MAETVQLSKDTLKKILQMHVDATKLLEEIPEMQDQGRISEASQHIGAELEARITQLNEVEKKDHVIREILEEIHNDKVEPGSIEELENEVLG